MPTIDVTPLPAKLPDLLPPTLPSEVYDRLPTWLKPEVELLPERFEALSDYELHQAVKDSTRLRPQQALAIKTAFWHEYERCIEEKLPQIQLNRAVKGITTIAAFKYLIDQEPQFLAWLLRPLREYTSRVKHLHSLAMDELDNILAMSHDSVDRFGNKIVDTKLLALKVKIYELIDARINGAFVQKIEQKSLNMNVNANANERTTEVANEAATDMQALDNKIKELHKQMERISSPPQIQSDMKALVQPNMVDKNSRD